MTYAVNVASLGSNGGTSISTWTTGTRPSSPLTGQFGFNATLGSLEVYNGTAWATAGGLNTQSVQTTGFTAVAGNIYPCNTTSAAFTVTLPASPTAGNQIQIIDYAGTFATNSITIGRNGSNIIGEAQNYLLGTNRQSTILTYIDATQGWVVSSAAYTTTPLLPTVYSVDYLIVAGGGAGGTDRAGGGGAGGLLNGSTNVTSQTAYSITIGSGGAYSGSDSSRGSNGNNSTGFSLTAIGGGGGGSENDKNGASGGSGGGCSYGSTTFGSGTSGQGNNGAASNGQTSSGRTTGGGGGKNSAGVTGNTSGQRPNGGDGYQWVNSTFYAGGGGGGDTRGDGGGSGSAGRGFGGSGGGGGGGGTAGQGTGDNYPVIGDNGTANTGGGGGGGGGNPSTFDTSYGGNGGSGVVIVRYSGSQRGTGGTVTSSGGYTYHTFTSSGTFTA